ncbi:MAG: transposase [Snowella sp.]|nr:MAG: transposase [Snowella sp.]
MSPKKLTEDDKQEILDLYRQTPETTSTLAERFAVSSSTISRFLKMSLSENEYEVLIQQKRLARASKGDSQLSLSLENTVNADSPAEPLAIATETLPTPLEIVEVVKSSMAEAEETATEENPIRVKTRKRRSTANEREPELPTEAVTEIVAVNSVMPATESDTLVEKKISQKIILKSESMPPPYLSAIAENMVPRPIALDATDLGELVEELGKLPKIQPELEDLDDELDLDDDDEEEDDWQEEEEASFFPSLSGSGDLTVLPLSAAVFPTTCYLVVDRTAELIVRPLKEFTHLGKIPPEETQQKTLPVFDNHRVARRFSNRTQRVIKVPNSNVLRKASSHLKAKGITRIFLDGRVYSLINN